jgi:hypothetical protein
MQKRVRMGAFFAFSPYRVPRPNHLTYSKSWMILDENISMVSKVL